MLEDDVKPPTKGDGFWINKISVENLRQIYRSGSASCMLSALGNAIDAIEDAKAHIDAQAVRLDAAERDAARYRLIRMNRLCHAQVVDPFPPDTQWTPEGLDAYIDTHRAAIASEAGK